MDILGTSEIRPIWQFILSHSTPGEFEQWVCTDPNAERLLGAAFHLDLISADYRDHLVVNDLKDRLRWWALELVPQKRQWGFAFGDVIHLEGSRRRLLLMGYWQTEEPESDLPHPRDFIDASWDAEERDRVIAYLYSAYILRGWLGPSSCRLGCPLFTEDMGNKDLTDGTWHFPEGYAHYLRHHGLKPDEAFLEHVRRMGYRIPDFDIRITTHPLTRLTPELRINYRVPARSHRVDR